MAILMEHGMLAFYKMFNKIHSIICVCVCAEHVHMHVSICHQMHARVIAFHKIQL